MHQDSAQKFLPTLVKLPYSIFFPAQDLGDKLTLCGRIRSRCPEIFDGEPLILPVPPKGPPDLPRIQLQSRDQSFVLQISLQRLSLEWNRRQNIRETWRERLRAFLDLIEQISRAVVGEYLRPVRFAFNPQFLIQMNRSVNEYLAREVIDSQRVLRRPGSIRIGLLDQFDRENRKLNLWMNLSSARQQNNPREDHGLVIHFDYNSAPESTRALSTDETLRHLAEIEGLMNDRMNAFFHDLLASDTQEDGTDNDSPSNE